jgi:hypothetical protein
MSNRPFPLVNPDLRCGSVSRSERTRATIVLASFAIVFAALTVSSYVRESATYDEPVHLTSGYTLLKLHDYYRIHVGSPPFLRIWTALPLLTMPNIQCDSQSKTWQQGNVWSFFPEFLYKQNDADQLLNRARFMTVLLGILLGILVFSWTRELFGFWTAAVVLGLYTTEPNLLAHAGLVTTDVGITCFMFGALYFLWRTTRALSFGNLLGLTAFFTLASISKFSALGLVLILLVLLSIHVWRRTEWSCRIVGLRQLSSLRSKALLALALLVWLAITAYVAIWAVYGFRYTPTAAGTERFEFSRQPSVVKRVPAVAAAVDWIDQHRLLPNACSQGFLDELARDKNTRAFFAGTVREGGWWYYFPVAFLLKTPIPLILLFFAGIIFCTASRKSFLQNEAFILLPLAIGVAVALSSKINVGLRHILPLYPLVLLCAAGAVAEFLRRDRKIAWVGLGALCLFQVVELTRIYPHYLAFFNEFIGGPAHGDRYLIDSNLDWGQDLKNLKRWMDQNGVQHINLSYFGTALPAYYEIKYTPLHGAPFFDRGLETEPLLPGYVAVSITNLHYGEYFGKNFFAPLLKQEPVAVIGHSINVYWMERPWW